MGDQFDRLLTFYARVGGLAATDEKYLMISPCRGYVKSIKLVSDTSTASSDGTNNWTFQVRNMTAGNNLLATAKTTNGAEMTGDTAYNLNVDQNLLLKNNDVLELQATKNNTPTDLTNAEIIAQVEMLVEDKVLI